MKSLIKAQVINVQIAKLSDNRFGIPLQNNCNWIPVIGHLLNCFFSNFQPALRTRIINGGRKLSEIQKPRRQDDKTDLKCKKNVYRDIFYLIIKITISSLVNGLKMSYFPLIRLPSCYRTVCYWIVCYWTVCYRTV